MASSRPSYCTLNDVQLRMYAGMGAGSVAVGLVGDPRRDEVLIDLIASTSRNFDDETGRAPGGFAPVYEARVFSGRGSPFLDVDEFGHLIKVEVNRTPGGSAPSWSDITPDAALGKLSTLPARQWPKERLWWLSGFYPDPWRDLGNIRVTAIWGAIQPDLGATAPTVNGSGNINDPLWPSLAGQSLATLQPIGPDGIPAGWWITPETVRGAVAEWAMYSYKSAQAGYSDTAGNSSGGPLTYRKGIPPEVNRVIGNFSKRRIKLAMVASDGTDIREANVYGSANPQAGLPFSQSRWSDWANYPASTSTNPIGP